MNYFYVLACLLFFGITSHAHNQGDTTHIVLTYGQAKKPINGTITAYTLTLVLAAPDNKKLDSFLSRTIVTSFSINRKKRNTTDTLKNFIVATLGKPFLDSLVKTGKLDDLPLAKIIPSEKGDSLFILPFLGFQSKNKPFVGTKDTGRVEIDTSSAPLAAVSHAKPVVGITNLILPVTISGNGCCDIIDPCDSIDLRKKVYANKILYLANKNLTVYFNKVGYPTIIGKVSANKKLYKDGFDLYNGYSFRRKDLRFRRNIVAPVGNPLGFEVININPDAFKVEITDTAVRFNNEADSLLSYLLSPSKGVSLFAGGTNRAATSAPTRQDTIRAVLARINEELLQFSINLQHASIYQHNATISAKIRVRDYIDQYLHGHFGKDPAESLNSFMVRSLSSDSADLVLIKSVNAAYTNLPATYYPLATNIPQTPGSFDRILFEFNITARESTPYSSLVTAKDEHAIAAYPVGGFKVDVSSGLYYSPNFNNDHYSARADSALEKRPSTGITDSLVKGNRLYRENLGKGEFGFASYLHFYPKLSPGLSVAGSIGAGISFNSKPQVRYFLGATVLLGKDNRIALTAGYMFGNASRLSNQYDSIGNHGNWLPLTETTPQVNNRFISRGFFGISYNIPFLKKNGGSATVSPPPTTGSSGNSGNSTTTTTTAAKTTDTSAAKKTAAATTTTSTATTQAGTVTVLQSGNALDSALKNAKKIKIKR